MRRRFRSEYPKCQNEPGDAVEGPDGVDPLAEQRHLNCDIVDDDVLEEVGFEGAIGIIHENADTVDLQRMALGAKRVRRDHTSRAWIAAPPPMGVILRQIVFSMACDGRPRGR